MEEHPINQKTICQSCAMPMKTEEDFGKELNGEKNKKYCKFCYQDGEFTDKGITLQEKIEKLAEMGKSLGLTEEQARHMAETKLPELKRWKNE